MSVNIRLTGDMDEVRGGLELLADELGITIGEGGVEIDVQRSEDGCLEASFAGGKGRIRWEQPVHFFRAVGLWVEAWRDGGDFSRIEKPRFESNGVMVDVSRNAVLKVDAVKRLLRTMALFGLNRMMLYTEDTFAVKEYPYFGYMRGRYSAEELKECDDYAALLGVEIVPCIQTLAHLTEALKWNYAAPMRDTSDILLVGEEETYTFIRRMIEAVASSLRSKRIHIGMDEAHQLGLGRYLEQHGYRKRFEIMNEHLHKVTAICDEYGLEPMIWSDMYFRLGSKTGGYYDLNAVIPEDVIEAMPRNVQFVYWDYYHDDPEFYRTFIDKHRAFGSMPIFAGGVWTWGSMAPNYGKTWKTTEAALMACKREGVRDVFATMWGDNGAETSIFSGLAGIALFAEHGYADRVEQADLARRLRFVTGSELSDFLALNAFDETPGVGEGNMKESNPSKFLLWQDVLIGLYDDVIKSLPMSAHYGKLAERMAQAAKRSGEWSRLFEQYEALARLLQSKCDIGIRLKAAYDARDREAMAVLSEEIGEIAGQTDTLRKLHRANWYADHKAFGWEVIDIRYGGLLSRLETARQRIHEFLEGIVEQLEELEEERLFYDAPWVMSEGALGRGAYHRIVTAGAFSN